MDMKKVPEDFDTAYNEAFNQGDAAGCAAFITDDVSLLAPDQSMVRGNRAFQELYQYRMNNSSGGTHSDKPVEYGVEGNLTYQV